MKKEVSMHDPVQRALGQQRTFSDTWIGSTKQSGIQRIGFFLISSFVLGVGLSMWYGIVDGMSLKFVPPMLIGTFAIAVGASGVVKAIWWRKRLPANDRQGHCINHERDAP